MTVRLRLAGVALLVISATSCSINSDSGPRNIAERDRRDLNANFDAAAGAAVGSGRIYLLSPEVLGQPRTLQSVARDVGDTPADALQALFKGPNSQELKGLLRSAIPAGTELLDVAQDGGDLVVNVSAELQQLTGEALIDGVAQIVLTASEISTVSDVSIAIDGVAQQWPAGSGGLQNRPLTRYDFPGLVVTSQPAFPSVPSPGAPAG
ncbi:MAG: GerMN domain-containing protein [Ilumatobacteraceae bacterium]